MNPKIKTHLLFPIIIYTVISIEIAAIVAAGVKSDQPAVWAVSTLFLTALLAAFAWLAKPKSLFEGAKMGLAWTAVFMLLDMVIVGGFLVGFSYFSDVKVWTPYLLGILIPALAGKLAEKH